jgi:hypothetical protein
MDLPQVPNDPNACWIEIPEMNDGHFAQLREKQPHRRSIPTRNINDDPAVGWLKVLVRSKILHQHRLDRYPPTTAAYHAQTN